MKANETLNSAEKKFKELVLDNRLKITTETNDEMYDFLFGLTFLGANLNSEDHDVVFSDHENDVTLTSWELSVEYNNNNYSIGIYEYFEAGYGFRNSSVLLNPEWDNASEVSGVEFFEEFDFDEDKEKIIQELFNAFNFMNQVDDIHSAIIKEESKKRNQERIQKYNGATVRVEMSVEPGFSSGTLYIVFPDGKKIPFPQELS